MSEQEESSSDESTLDTNNIFHTMQEMMKSMIDEVDESLDTLHQLYTDVHHSQDLFAMLHLQEKLQPFLKRVADEKRISDDGLTITLLEEEKKELGIFTEQTTIYTVCEKIILKTFETK